MFAVGQVFQPAVAQRTRAGQRPPTLLLLLRVERVLAETRAVLLQLELLAAGLPPQDVVLVARLFADEENDFGFLLTLGHGSLLIQDRAASFNPELEATAAGGTRRRLRLRVKPK